MRSQATAAERPLVVTLVGHAIGGPGGMEEATGQLVRRLAPDVEFVVVATHLDPALRGLVRRWIRVPLPRRPASLHFVLFWLLGTVIVRFRRGDLVHTMGAITGNDVDLVSVHYCHAAARRRTGRYAPGARGLRRLNTGTLRWLALRAERWTYRPDHARLLAAVSPGAADELAHEYADVPVVLTPNGVDHVRFAADGVARAALRREHGVTDDAVVVLFVGGEWGRKGLGSLVRALALLASRDAEGAGPSVAPEVELWVVGEGDVQALPDAGSATVRHLGRRGDVERLCAAADVFCLPSAYETFSMAAYEAAAAGLPLVCTHLHGVTELIGDDEDGGRWVQPEPASIAGALGELAADPALRSTLGLAARERASGFGWDESAGAVAGAYRRLRDVHDADRAAPVLAASS